MEDPVIRFRNEVSKLKTGEKHVYYQGHLASAISSSPTLNVVRILATGLYMLGKAELLQTRIIGGTEYAIRMRQPIHPADFDRGRKLWLQSQVV